MKSRPILLALLILSIGLLVACTSKNNQLKQVNIDEVNQYFEENKTGFVLLVTDNDEYFIPTVERLAKERNIEVAMYNPYQSDGKNDNEGASIFPNSTDVKGDAMYYVENNEIKGELAVNKYADSQLSKEVLNFMDIHK